MGSIVTNLLAKPFARPLLISLAVLAIGAAVALTLNSYYKKGEKAGESIVIEKVQTETIKRTEKARDTKEKADDAVRATPYDANVDSLR